VARYWAEELAKQTSDGQLKASFDAVSKELGSSEAKVLQDMIDCQGVKVDLGGYYHVDKAKTDKAMNPSETFNRIVLQLEQGPDAKI